ncbi:hypothetical protein ENSA5_59290 [Enhygromyxa salina]|uniref:Uncharacterized protein n=1 Tax=Enhygromyxa salina TaxID=215803 RepID=A0A2S9XDT5_9BACT|nr:hypothetical protein [Enhygromyxa salina]PRP91017.1 hypothetical protein ENSA5_59290 [Enhygromyxa salina]
MPVWKLMLGAGPPLALIATLAHVPDARAGNTVHPRTPVLWPDAPCIQTVDRSAESNFAFSYEIPAEDTLLSVDEFDDSRTHQFIGFCRQWPAGRPPPRYISTFDLERSVEAGLEQPELLDDPESTLETSAAWAGCWTRITADDARRPITYAAAADPVIWASAEVPAGTWLVAGYTWEPPYNLWMRAPWVVRVTDEAEPTEPVQAAATIADTADSLDGEELLELQICVDASPGSTLALAWASTKPAQLEWSTLATIDLDTGLNGPGELLVPFSPPESSWGQTLVLRATIEQPQGDAYVGHGLAPLIVFADPGDGDGDGDGNGDGDGGSANGDTDTGSDTGTETSAGADPSSGGGSRCSVDPRRGKLDRFGAPRALPFWALFLVLVRRRHARERSA